jgi:arginyl-tRNA synthetase
VQYAAVRVSKILQENQPTEKETGAYLFEPEKPLLLKLADYPSVIKRAADQLEPHQIATYLYELARELNRYYETTRVLDQDSATKNARLQVMQKLEQVFQHGLSILGIEIPEKM